MELNPCVCFYCHNKTSTIYKSMSKVFNNKQYMLNNIPMFFCKECDELFYPEAVLKLFKRVHWQTLGKSDYEFEFLERNAPRE